MVKKKKLIIIYKSIGLIIFSLLNIYIIILQIDEYKRKSNEVKKENCFLKPEFEDKKIIHIIITSFLMELTKPDEFVKKMYTKEFILNGIRVMKKYLFPSLQYQSCRDFIWMLIVGDKANITYIKSLLNFYRPFKSVIISSKKFKNYIRNLTKNADVLITTRIDYDDRIYWKAVNDVRKVVNISKPMFVYGYNRGFFYFEEYDFYSPFFSNYNNNGTMSIFQSLILVLNKVNDSYTIYDVGPHTMVRKIVLENYKRYGIEKLDYEPAFIDNNAPKFVYVRQKFSWSLKYFNKDKIKIKIKYFNLDKFYGIKK